MKIIKVKNNLEAGQYAAAMIKKVINANPKSVLGLATGSSPVTTYQTLILMNQANEISFKTITTFNLDEYLGLDSANEQSYRYFMNNQLFNHVDIDLNNTFIPDNEDVLNPHKYDDLIAKKGGIDLQLLGLGINGHIGFNEPGTSFESLTSIVDLTESTIEANTRFFADKSQVPTKAISMGLKSIMNAKQILLIAKGENKAEAIFHLVEGKITSKWPCSILQNHANVTVIIDEAAASKLQENYDSK